MLFGQFLGQWNKENEEKTMESSVIDLRAGSAASGLKDTRVNDFFEKKSKQIFSRKLKLFWTQGLN